MPLVDLGPVKTMAARDLCDVLRRPNRLHQVLLLELDTHLAPQPVTVPEGALPLRFVRLRLGRA